MRKCNTYAVEIVHLNGNRQIRESEDIFNYNSNINLYHNIKEEYINREVTINFVGFTEDNDQIFFFGKKNTLIENETRNIKDLINVITEASNELKNQYNVVSKKLGYYDKEKSNIDHLLIEAVDLDELTDREKIEVYDKIREVNLFRRDYKILDKIRENTLADLDSIIARIKNMSKKYDEHITTNSQKLKSLINRNSNYAGVHLTKEIPYKDFKEKIAIMKMIDKKYDKVILFPERNVIACYNKCS